MYYTYEVKTGSKNLEDSVFYTSASYTDFEECQKNMIAHLTALEAILESDADDVYGQIIINVDNAEP